MGGDYTGTNIEILPGSIGVKSQIHVQELSWLWSQI